MESIYEELYKEAVGKGGHKRSAARLVEVNRRRDVLLNLPDLDPSERQDRLEELRRRKQEHMKGLSLCCWL